MSTSTRCSARSGLRWTRSRRGRWSGPPRPSADADVQRLLAEEDGRFEVDPRLTAEERQDHARLQLGLERILREGGYGAYSTHFDAIADDGRFARLPLAAASSLMAAGFGYAAEGDPMTAALMSAARNLLGTTQFTEMYAMDFARDAFLMSHMGEGNWVLARADRPVRLIKRSLGIGGLDDPPTFLFQYETGPCTLASLLALPDGRFRLVVSEGEILDSEELPGLEMPYGFFRPASGVEECAERMATGGRAASPGSQPRASIARLAHVLRDDGHRARHGVGSEADRPEDVVTARGHRRPRRRPGPSLLRCTPRRSRR